MNALGADLAWLRPLLALAPVWPLVLLAGLALPPWRGSLLRLLPWAALPALLIAVAAPPASLPLPGLLLGGSLQLDAAGRWSLAAVALMWLTGGWLGRDRLCRPRRALAWLLALTGALWLPLAGDLPSAMAASVLAAYPLYGLRGGGRGARALLASVVIADLLILEALLLLAKAGSGLDFDSLRGAFAETGSRGIVLGLLVIGFGIKAGLMGLHYWLAPTLEDAQPWQIGPVLAFALAAGLLPLFRLLPLGETSWPSAAAALALLALGGGLWAAAVGLLQATARTRLAYVLSALGSAWLGLLGLGLATPAAAIASTLVLPPAMALSVIGVVALLLVSSQGHDSPSMRPNPQEEPSAWSLALLSALLVLLTLLGAAVASVTSAAPLDLPLLGSLACVGLLLGASVPLPTRGARQREPGLGQRAAAVLVAGGLVMAVLLVWSPEIMSVLATGSGQGSLAITSALLGGFVVGPAAPWLLVRVPRLPAGDLLVVIERALSGLVAAWHRLGLALAQWRDRLETALDRRRRRLSEQAVLDVAERRLGRWSAATLLMVLVGAAVALLLQPG